jgi:acyl-CoA thioester hydrolase
MLRKTTTPDDIMEVMNEYKSENVQTISKEYLKTLPFRPENIDVSRLENFK